MISIREGWHYLELTILFTLLRGITLSNNGNFLLLELLSFM